MPIIWGVMIIAGIGATGWTASQAKEAFDRMDDLTKTLVVGGGLYVAYRVAQQQGWAK